MKGKKFLLIIVSFYWSAFGVVSSIDLPASVVGDAIKKCAPADGAEKLSMLVVNNLINNRVLTLSSLKGSGQTTLDSVASAVKEINAFLSLNIPNIDIVTKCIADYISKAQDDINVFVATWKDKKKPQKSYPACRSWLPSSIPKYYKPSTHFKHCKAWDRNFICEQSCANSGYENLVSDEGEIKRL